MGVNFSPRKRKPHKFRTEEELGEAAEPRGTLGVHAPRPHCHTPIRWALAAIILK